MGKKSKNKAKNNKNNNLVVGADGSIPPANRHRRFNYHQRTSREFNEQGELRKSAEHDLEAYRLVDNSNLSDPTSRYLYVTFHNFTSNIRNANKKEGNNDAKADLKVLAKFADSQAEPSLVRALAACAAVDLHCNHDNQLAAEFCRQTIAICEGATEEEKRRVVYDDALEMTQVGGMLSQFKKNATRSLADLTRTLPAPSTPTVLQTYFGRALSGGESCDACGKTRTELGVTHMNCCARCGMQYYCSTDCQRTKWKAGHKKACRMPGQIEVGDAMKLVGLDATPDLNWKLGHVVGPADNDRNSSNNNRPVQWMVKLIDSRQPPFVVDGNNLAHIRPAV